MHTVFGVTVQLTDPALARRTLTGTIRAGSSDELAEALAELLNLRVTHRDQNLIFSTASEPQTHSMRKSLPLTLATSWLLSVGYGHTVAQTLAFARTTQQAPYRKRARTAYIDCGKSAA